MTTKNPYDPLDPQPADQAGPDPVGPISLPTRSRIGSRAFALVGAGGVLATGIAADTVMLPWTHTISV